MRQAKAIAKHYYIIIPFNEKLFMANKIQKSTYVDNGFSWVYCLPELEASRTL